jgi:hypothetical protein
VRAVVVLSPSLDYLSGEDLALLRGFLAQGGKVVTSPGVGASLVDVTGASPELRCQGLVEQWGTLYVAQQGLAVLFEDVRHEVLAPFWQEVLGLASIQPGYHIVTERYAFHYHIGPGPAAVQGVLPFVGYGYRYDAQAQPVERLYGLYLGVTLARREFVFLERDRWAWPWRV